MKGVEKRETEGGREGGKEGDRDKPREREEKENKNESRGGERERERERERVEEKETNGVEDRRVDVRILCTNSHTTHTRRFPCPILRLFFASMKDMILLLSPSCTHGPLFRPS